MWERGICQQVPIGSTGSVQWPGDTVGKWCWPVVRAAPSCRFHPFLSLKNSCPPIFPHRLQRCPGIPGHGIGLRVLRAALAVPHAGGEAAGRRVEMLSEIRLGCTRDGGGQLPGWLASQPPGSLASQPRRALPLLLWCVRYSLDPPTVLAGRTSTAPPTTNPAFPLPSY